MAEMISKPENQITLDRTVDTSKAPGLWPRVEQQDISVAALLNRHQWLAMVKEESPGALSSAQRDFLLAMGFREGSSGRYFYPGYPTPRLVSQLCSAFDCQADGLMPDQVITVTPQDTFKPNIPLEVQAGVRWYWKHQPRLLKDEIEDSLAGREDELSTTTLRAIESERLENMVRLQVLVGQSMEGEITPLTEPVLAMGLYRGTASYGPQIADWPEDLQAFHEQLAEVRGETPPATLEIDPLYQYSSDPRPGIGQRIQWNTPVETVAGFVVGHDDSETSLWVVRLKGAEPTTEIGFLFPRRERIALESVVGFNEKPETQDEPEPTPEPAASVETDKKPQAPVTLTDLPNLAMANRKPGDILSEANKAQVAMAMRLGLIMGNHPLMMQPNQAKDAVISWRTLDDIIVYRPTRDQSERARDDAEIVVRDTSLEWFNRAQPETPDGRRSPVAVFPAQAPVITDVDLAMSPEIASRLERFEFCRVGIHPLVVGKIEAALEDWSENEAPKLHDPSGGLVPMLRSTASFYRSSSLHLSQMSFSMGDHIFQSTLRKYFQDVKETVASSDDSNYETHLKTLDHMLREEIQEKLSEHLQGLVFTRHQDAHDFVNGTGERFTEVVSRNEQLLKSLADLSNRSLETIWKTRHPIFVVLDEMKSQGLPYTGRAEGLAALNIDLSEHIHWLGQMAQMNGVSIDGAHTHRVMENLPQEAIERLSLQGRVRPLPRGMITTGLLTREGETEPFQILVLAESSQLRNKYLLGDKVGLHTPNLFNQDDDNGGSSRHESLGRLVDLNAMAPIQTGEALTRDNQVITEESLSALKPTVIGLEDFGYLDAHPVSSRIGLSRVETARASAEVPQETLGYTPRETVTDALDLARQSLFTMIPGWRNRDAKREQVLEAIKLWITDFKPLKKLANPTRVAEDILERLIKQSDSEMVLVGAKTSSRQVRYHMRTITREDLLNSEGDRADAVERKVLEIKNYDRRAVKGWHFATFDLATVLRPEALRYLSELRANEKLGTKGTDTETKPARRGARQDRGQVAGLAIKDLRGKASTIISNIASADKEDQLKFVTKTKLWDTPDWVTLRSPSEEDRNSGERPMEPVVAAFFDELRKNTPMKPPANISALNLIYTRYVLGIRDAFQDIRTEEELHTALKPDGRLEKLVTTMQKECDEQGCPEELLAGRNGQRYYHHMMAFGGTIMSATRRSKKNTHWDIKDTQGTGRRSVDDDDQPQVGAMPMLGQLVRKGAQDYRSDTNVTEQTMIATFGFSGIEYGKSMTQKDRETYLNEAYDGFLDLANVMNVPPQAMSLGGTLGLAFGSRGKGGRNAALAHFEPSNNAINLTRMKGAGSMAHEFGHALANYLFRLSRGVQGSRSPGDITDTLDRQINRRQSQFEGGQLRQGVTDAIAFVLKSLRYAPVQPDDGNRRTSYYFQGAVNADNRKGSRGTQSEPYWASIKEMFARAFETYVDATLKDSDSEFRNDFLVRPDKLRAWGTDVEDRRLELEADRPEPLALPANATDDQRRAWRTRETAIGSVNRQISDLMPLYPSGDELKAATKTFNKLFETLETRPQQVMHEHLGEIELPMLYSHDTTSIVRVSEREQCILSQCIMDEVARMCGHDVWVGWHKELHDSEGNAVAGRYRNSDSADQSVRAVIDLAYGTPLNTAHHEAFHFAQSHLLTEQEQARLDADFQPGEPLHQRLVNTLISTGKYELVEMVKDNPLEAQAYAYELWVQGKLDVRLEEQPSSIFGRVRKFFDRVLGISQNAGFHTAQDVFQAFHQGQLAQRNQTTTLRSNGNEQSKIPGREQVANNDERQPAPNKHSQGRQSLTEDNSKMMTNHDSDDFNAGPQLA